MENKRAKVIMLSTDVILTANGKEPKNMFTSNGRLFTNGFIIGELINDKGDLRQNHLYFTTDENPKEGDWCVVGGGLGRIGVSEFQKNVMYSITPKKIIATTNTKLKLKEHQNGCMLDRCLTNACNDSCKLPQPSQSFIEKYCKVGGIDEVLVEYTNSSVISYKGENGVHKIASKPKVNSHNEITIHPIKSDEEQALEFLKDIHVEWAENWGIVVDMFGQDITDEWDRIVKHHSNK